ncbi:Uncharacterized membrane protein YesL [Gracilibacillus orientalis]|uniref:Uncharacterized membrane protein YesL n=1 Tax=Gracilibacillus orientalis TaxID=334253 RepID=A0A1I4N8F7_9BACI|nr:YesL family protein [Gracilibacillus orientalis]SFM11577.1 Uncharacterized membrane protein YesL [Gracilibacillus orientalis]
MFGLSNVIYKTCNWIMLFAYVNVLWWVFTLVGLGIFGLFPATIATFTVVRKWIIDKEDSVYIFKLFVSTYKQLFVQSNAIGLVLIIFGLILYTDFNYINQSNGMFINAMTLVFSIILVLFAVISLFIFPVYVHYKASFIQYFKFACVIGMINPIITFVMFAVIFLSVFLSTAIPFLIPFFSISITSYLLMELSNKAFRKVEQKNAKHSKNVMVN